MHGSKRNFYTYLLVAKIPEEKKSFRRSRRRWESNSYSYNKSQRDALLYQIYLIKYSTCFGHVHCPSSGVSQHCIHAIGICHASYVDCLLAELA